VAKARYLVEAHVVEGRSVSELAAAAVTSRLPAPRRSPAAAHPTRPPEHRRAIPLREIPRSCASRLTVRPPARYCAQLIAETDEELVVPALVLSELDYWCHERLTGEVRLSFLQDVLDGAHRIKHPTIADLERCVEVQRTDADLRVGVVDASVLAAVERLGEPKVATLDHRHFGTMRSRHVEALELLPASG
jgi:predicted nucleic acid-binding protein